ncbi:MAG TPA: tripartite tricarboxylate transporter substrate binding protein [Burkholderiales bacterium]|nr:tripartite tricarboxylate transporter substrate binding protein [Burkholderiales bacterium]
MKNSVRLLAVLFMLTGAGAAFAQGYPNRPIKVVIPWPPGQATDLVARMVSEKLVPVLGQPMIADNKGGAGGTIGSDFAAKQPADGYTILAGSSGPISISPNVQKVGYDPIRDFAPITLLAVNPFVLVVNPSVPAKNVKELIALLRANPGKYSFSSSGSGATSHLMTVLFNSMAKVDAVHVPYKGSSQSVTDVVSGQVAYTIETVPGVISFVKSGRLRALAVSSAKRSAAMPELPPIADDLPGYDMFGWIGWLAPAGTPSEPRARLAAESQKVLQAADIKERFLALGLEPSGLSPEEFTEFLKKQNARYGSIAKQANVRAD